jgi:phosphopentomutase
LRVVLIVLDGAGCGALPDAASYGDAGADTLGHVARRVGLRVPHLRALGLGRVAAIGGDDASSPAAAYGRMAEASAGKDSVTGHWEIAGIVLDRPFPTFPAGFPAPLMDEFARRIGRATLGNVAASGTEILDWLGAEHVRTGRPIVYTSADSVFQVAAHEEVIPVPELYRMCDVAFELAARGLGVSRVIARPFVGVAGAWRRTAGRHDFTLPPPDDTLLDHLAGAGVPVTAIGKVRDLFAGRGVTRAVPTRSDEEGMDRLLAAVLHGEPGLLFLNLVDFDTVYGHRNDPEGYAANLERFDARLGELRAALDDADLLAITADHGNDPTTAGTDHTREHVPVLLSGRLVRGGVDLGTRATFADLGQTLAEGFGVGPLAHGTSFLEDVVVNDP